MSTNMRKCISLGPAGFLNPSGDYSFNKAINRLWLNDTKTKWVRMWVDWSVLEPSRGNMNVALRDGMDQQIQLARRDGFSVILALMHKFPGWVDGQPDPYKVPNDRSRNGAWAGFIYWLYDRYKPSAPAVADASIQILEIVNEPNLTFTPQDSALAGKVIEMFATAQSISGDFNHQIHLGGPALSDGGGIAWPTFVDQMKTAALATNFRASANFIWTHHNYGDIEQNSDSSRAVRDRINSWWTGYDEGDGPVVFCTEGGARLVRVPNRDLNLQNELVTTTFEDLKSAARIGMQTNYLTCDDASGTYSGLLGPPPTSAQRPVYNGWKARSTGSTGVARWNGSEDLGGWTTYDCSVLSQHAGHVEIFARGSDGAFYNNWQNWGPWSGWSRIGGNWASGPAAISIKDGSMHLFAVGQDRQMYGAWWVPNVGWSNFYPLGGGCTYDPGVSSWSEHHIELFMRGNDGKLYHKWWFDWAGWSAWHQLWGGQVVGSPSAVSWADGRTDVVWQATDRSLYHMWCVNGGWNGPESLGGWLVGHPEICSWKPGHLDIICGGSGNKLWRKTYDRYWSQWEPIVNSEGFQFSPGAVSWGPGRIDIAFQRDHRMHHMWFA